MANHPNRSSTHQIEYTVRAGGVDNLDEYAAALRHALAAEFPDVTITVNVEHRVHGEDRVWSRGTEEWEYDDRVREIAADVGATMNDQV